jgi:uncharacterized protein YdcH (DUF465 family)
MPTNEKLTVAEIDDAIAQLRARRNALKASKKTSQRKILTLARRRERLMQQVNALDDEIRQLRTGQDAVPAPETPRLRKRKTQVVSSHDAILECVKRHTMTKRATIVEECQSSTSGFAGG